ncbi:MAG: sporulation protein YabP [Clostridia bacterium]|nr:sporulation protein YabP [Clostridia bacterium]
MNEKERLQARPAHNIIMENRKMLSLSGVKDVDSFDEEGIVLLTELGELTIRGTKLHISHLNQETGEVNVDGEISELVYSDVHIEPQGFFARLFR